MFKGHEGASSSNKWNDLMKIIARQGVLTFNYFKRVYLHLAILVHVVVSCVRNGDFITRSVMK